MLTLVYHMGIVQCALLWGAMPTIHFLAFAYSLCIAYKWVLCLSEVSMQQTSKQLCDVFGMVSGVV